jgi:hypothetical protein
MTACATAPLTDLSSACSLEAAALKDSAEKATGSLRDSFALYGHTLAAIWALDEIAQEASVPNWDGYDALPANTLALSKAKEVITILPAELPLPFVSVEPDGCISLDWLMAKSRVFTMSLGSSGSIPYAWIDGTSRGHAVEEFDGKLPSRVISEIKRICRK